MAESTVPGPGPVVVQEAGFEAIMHPIGLDGVIGDPSDSSVMYSQGQSAGLVMHVRANKRAIVRGSRWANNGEDLPVPVAPNVSGQPRIDRGVLRFSRSTWQINAAIIQGVPGSSTVPAVTQDPEGSGVWELPLCHFPVPHNATFIDPSSVVREEVYLGEEPYFCKAGQRPPHRHGRIVIEDNGKVLISIGGQWRAFALSHDETVVSFSVGGQNPPGPPSLGRIHFILNPS